MKQGSTTKNKRVQERIAKARTPTTEEVKATGTEVEKAKKK